MEGQEYRTCKKCKTTFEKIVVQNNYSICPNCGAYLRVHAYRRIESLEDKGTFREFKHEIDYPTQVKDPAYKEKINEMSAKYNLDEAIAIGEMKIGGHDVAIGVMDGRFLMGSMGYIVGERVTRLFEIATRKKLPVILFCCSGGARMQEGMISLMQMEKTANAVKVFNDAGGFYISVLTNPTMGGVTASFAMLGDVILAEKGAMIGFAGARVVEQNTGEKLPDDFQTAEFQKSHGYVDDVVTRQELRDKLIFLLDMHKRKINLPKLFGMKRKIPFRKRQSQKRSLDLTNRRTAWETVEIARSQKRPTCRNYIDKLFDNFYELYGDRIGGEDHAIIGGIASFHGRPVTVIGNQKGKENIQDALYRNFGMASPSGYRKVMRLAEQAEKFGRPIVFFIDTIGADCRKQSEINGQGVAIANVLNKIGTLKTPTLSIIIGEGGSGGALALGIGNEVWMLENAVYSVLTPESYSSIIWKDNSRAPEAANRMKMCARDLLELGIIDRIIDEETPVTVENMAGICKELDMNINSFLMKYEGINPDQIAKERYIRFRNF
ncbi:acetyl-CoA carboxylase carboxyl transferase subunit beta [Pseudobutyrivibrio sp. ACV-2]|uniref:acetyl-coenzyme A carboxylase carboxyl transferase subunits beta/alpha n=1 Tax=Pseudobutyrivibrio sp. ACV-2 TaxID=1520801 RepID=UPI000897846E|nr:carboxyltransferase subunit alpha [Pseudobutyrivibrio sp. ACV-2]SEA06656.1 acetyl-CoA carboxylase carboxyl transferase subunit beta [Pseudobutyrivibrio sp. ACV-2]